MATLAERLADAEAAQHALLTGTAVVELRDQNGETVKYNAATRSGLAAYIESLRRQISGRTVQTGPMRVFM